MLNINFDYIKQDWTLVFKFIGEFSNENADTIFTKLKNIIAKEKIYNLVFNMSKVEFINSRWAWWIAGIFDDIDTLGWKIYITNMNESIEDTLDLLWLFLFISKAKTDKEALNLITTKK